MRFAYTLATTFLVCLCAVGARAELKLANSVERGAWEISSFVDTATGIVAFCGISNQPVDRSLIGLRLRPDGGWSLSLFTQKADWTGAKEIDFLWRLRDAPARRAKGEDIGEGSVTTEVQKSAALLEEFRGGGRLHLSVNGKSFDLDLQGIDMAMAEMERCLATGGQSLRAAAAPSTGTASPGSERGPSSFYKFGGWAFETATNPKGQFEGCFAGAPDDGDFQFGLEQSKEREWALVFGKTNWKRGHDLPIEVSIKIDQGIRQYATGGTVDNTGITVSLKWGMHVLRQIAAGDTIEIGVAGETFRHNLTGSAGAIAEIERCVDRGLGIVRPSPARPVSPNSVPAFPTETPSSQR